MDQYNTLNVKLSYSQIIELRSKIKYGTEVTLKLSSNVVGHSDDENNFPHKLIHVFQSFVKLLQIIPQLI